MIGHAHLVQLSFDRADVEVMAPLDMVQSETVIFQDPDYITVRPVEGATWHIALYTSKSVVSDLDGRRNRLIC